MFCPFHNKIFFENKRNGSDLRNYEKNNNSSFDIVMRDFFTQRDGFRSEKEVKKNEMGNGIV